ncbi:MAG TPA: PqiC family protein [Polyangia bacterium]|nr:PqiC family protein [Polyangia bacterium]
MRYAFAFAVTLCAGCSFLKPSVDPTTYFVLTATATSAPGHAVQRVVGLEAVRLPEYLDRPQLVTRIAPNQLRISDIERWAEPLGDGLTSTLRHDLAAALGDANVLVQPGATHVDADVTVDVVRCERVGADAVELVARWKLRDGNGNVQLVKDAHVRLTTARADAQSAVAALSQAVATLAGEIATAIGNH